MANKFENISNYNESIANESNNIGQKLFAYISKGKNINDRIRDKFKKSLIFIGDEGQIYNPLTNTYVGIGQTAYTATISYIEDAQEKISTLSKMLASSMVSSIYANWSKDEWMSDTYNPVLKDSIENSMPSKIYATNEIVLKGLGDYDPTTKLAASREYSHITDDNAKNDSKLTTLYDNTYKNVGQTSKTTTTYKYYNDSDTTIEFDNVKIASHSYLTLNFQLSEVDRPTALQETLIEKTTEPSAFATSGITVSLNKGLNKYLYSYTFTYKPTGINVPSVAQCIPYVGMGESTEYFRKVVNIYATDEKLANYKDVFQSILDENGDEFILETDFSPNKNNPYYPSETNLWAAFWAGIEPVYEDDFNPNGVSAAERKKHQLFKQSANTLTIDDKLTWSYISSAYSYTVNFSKEYTDNQVNNIYRELLGEESALIPATVEQVKVLIPNDLAQLNTDKYVWNESTKTWTAVEDESGDDINESSSNLGKYVLDYSSTFVQRHLTTSIIGTTSNPLPADNLTTYNYTIGDKTISWKILPWQVLDDLSQAIALAKQDAIKNFETTDQQNSEEQLNTCMFNAAAEAINNFKPRFFNGSEYKYVSGLGNNDALTFVDEKESGINLKSVLNISDNEIKGFDILSYAAFMGYDRTLASAHLGDASYDRSITFEVSQIGIPSADSGETAIPGILPSGTQNGEFESSNDNDHNKTYGYEGEKYNQPYLYTIVDPKIILAWNEESFDEDDTPLFVVNTSHVAMDAINLADGIQTLKEVAYVLDIITDGWGNQYDPEGNGILLTYTIANNHERIVDHEKRLQALEGGKNVVRAIFKEADSMSKYVNLHITSDTSWIASTIEITKIIDDVSDESFNLSKTWYGVIGSGDSVEMIALPKSYLYSYVLQVKEYNNHVTNHDSDKEKYPEFNSLYGFTGLTGFIEFSYADDSESWFKDSEGNPVVGKATYTGQVGLGIDLNIATSYSTYIYCDHTSDGYEVVDLNSSYINKRAILNIKLPSDITYDTRVKNFTEPISNDGVYSEPYVNETLRFTNNANVNNKLKGKSVNDVISTGGLLVNYANEIKEFLNNFDGINAENTYIINPEIESREYTGLDLSLDFVINPTTCVNKEGYRTQLYGDDITSYDIYSYSTTNISENPITVGETTIAAGTTVELNTDYSGTEGLTVTAIRSIPSSSNSVFYIRKSEQEVLYYNTAEDALTNVKWVSSYVSHTVENVKQSLKEIEFEAYQYSKNLISQLDGNFIASYSYYVAGISQKDGKVTPIVRELPKDSIIASTKVWGETTDVTKQYVGVSSAEIENEIAMDTPLFIKTVDYYEVPLSDGYNSSLGNSVENGNDYVKLDDKFVFIFTNGKYEYVDSPYEADCLSSAKIGRSYRNFIQLYFKRDGYVQIDGADLRKVITDETYHWEITISGTTYKTPDSNSENPTKGSEIYKLSNSGQPEAVKKYISAEVDYQSDYTDGVGGNNFKVTAHITKLSDASEDNSGLVDAYDVRNTLDNMFEWVDLSRWDEDEPKNTTTNPVNTNSIEEGGDIDAANRINATKVANSGRGVSNELGYPIDLSAPVSSAESAEPATPEGGDTGDDTGGDENESEEGA